MTKWKNKARPNATARVAYGYKPSEDDPLVLIPDDAITPILSKHLNIWMKVTRYVKLQSGLLRKWDEKYPTKAYLRFGKNIGRVLIKQIELRS